MSRRSARFATADDVGRAAPRESAAVVAPLTTPATGRLRHTVTLGSSYGGSTRSDVAAFEDRVEPDAPSAPDTVYVVPPFYGGWGAPGWVSYDGFGAYCDGCSRRPAARRPAKPSAIRPPALGEDWTPPPSFGPRFPFKTAPADPWR